MNTRTARMILTTATLAVAICTISSAQISIGGFTIGSSNSGSNNGGIDPLKTAQELQRKRVKAFHEAIKPYKSAIDYFDNAYPDGAIRFGDNMMGQFKKHLASLATVDSIANSSEFKDVHNNKADDYYCKPDDIRAVAAARNQIAERSVRATVQQGLELWTREADRLASGLQNNDGWVRPSGNIMYKLVFEREEGHADLMKNITPKYEAVGLAVPADIFAELDAKLDALWATIEAAAPSFTWPTDLKKDGTIEGIAKKKMGGVAGITVLKTGMLKNEWGITKNDLGIPIRRYRTGVILYSKAGEKLCRYREFTYEEEYAGGGTYSKSEKVWFSEGMKLVKCP
ncbi:MAG: hypothetical protein IT211_05290 [Armatimonadetes bacterium]|nr:hypothetical protein [Armatimonadota bacterium]